ncbi:transposase [Nonomuraea dietziae]|uniref:transposase n=1 Tax=Nonomuraea dietziae TaxID=65515 RepID=UPI00344A1345
MTRWHDLTDGQWAALLPAPSGRGRPPKWSRRQLIDGIRWRIRTGAPWRDVPEFYAPWSTVYGRFRRGQRDGIWAKILAALQAHADAAGKISWTASADSTISRTHQSTACWVRRAGNHGARRRGAGGVRSAVSRWKSCSSSLADGSSGGEWLQGRQPAHQGEGMARTCGPDQPERAPSPNRKEDRPPATEAA